MHNCEPFVIIDLWFAIKYSKLKSGCNIFDKRRFIIMQKFNFYQDILVNLKRLDLLVLVNSQIITSIRPKSDDSKKPK